VPQLGCVKSEEPSRLLCCGAGAGGSLESIAAAKAGIMRAGRPVVLGSQPRPDAKRVLCRRAKELRCRWARPAWGLCPGSGTSTVVQRSTAVAAHPAQHCLWQRGASGNSWRSGGDGCLAAVQDV
jgi:hypothetical protein